MSNSSDYRHAVSCLRGVLKSSASDQGLKSLVDAREEVLSRYQPMFTAEGIKNLTEDEFRDFLMPRNNRHWSGLQRMGPRIVSDMNALKEGLLELLDETMPIAARLDHLLVAVSWQRPGAEPARWVLFGAK